MSVEFYVPTPAQLADLFDYMIWGDEKCIEVARSVPAAGFVADQGMSLGSVHKLLVHMMSAESVWLARFQGANPTRLENDSDYPTLAAVEARWPIVHTEIRSFLAGQTAATLARSLSYVTTQGQPMTMPLGQVLLHMADHATYHRGQLNSMAKRAGGTPLPIMRYTYVLERESRVSGVGGREL